VLPSVPSPLGRTKGWGDLRRAAPRLEQFPQPETLQDCISSTFQSRDTSLGRPTPGPFPRGGDQSGGRLLASRRGNRMLPPALPREKELSGIFIAKGSGNAARDNPGLEGITPAGVS
jgi:hypothetical protein